MKLVRNKVPQLHPQHEYRVADAREVATLLRLKLMEEAGEVVGARNDRELLEELGDVLEVVTELAQRAGIGLHLVYRARDEKAALLGDFREGWVMTKFEEIG